MAFPASWHLLPALLLALPVTAAVAAEQVTGVASVIDGDTIEIHGTHIRLHGVDAPESAQLCFRPDRTQWRCGQQAALVLADRIGEAPVVCRRTDTDQYGRTIAVCFRGTENLNAWMVAEGWAVAYRQYSMDYVADEERAKRAKLGIWSGSFEVPWDWRALRRK